MERLEDRSVLGVVAGGGLEILSLRRRWDVDVKRWRSSSTVRDSMRRWWRRRCRSGDAGVVVKDGGEEGASLQVAADRGGPGLRRCRRRGAKGPKAFPLLKQGSWTGSVADGAVEQLGRGVRNVAAERLDKAGEGAVPVRCEESLVDDIVWPNQQFGLYGQVPPFLQTVLLGERSRCCTLTKLVKRAINLINS